VVEYETVVFTGGLRGDTSKFLGSSNEVDDHWDELYNSMYSGKALLSAWQ
jgi:hypothetical protein